eukprot:scaffold150455_cov30-Tisochrysis_lutea.AAC.1
MREETEREEKRQRGGEADERKGASERQRPPHRRTQNPRGPPSERRKLVIGRATSLKYSRLQL